MLTNSIKFKNFKIVKSNKDIKKKLKFILNNKSEVIKSLSGNYKDNYKINVIKNEVKNRDIRLIGMGGSILGSRAIFNFFKAKIKKNFIFIDNLSNKKKNFLKKKIANIVISKSGNTLETIANINLLIKKNERNIFITEKKSSYLYNLAYKLKSEVIEHNNFIGGRFSVLSEVGMLPAQLMGLNPKKFRQFDNLIKNKKFVNNLVYNTSTILHLIKKKKFNSVILNYDEKSNYFFKWYQQLVAESLGKKGKGILPIISEMPKDNHSVMQLYLDGLKNNFFTFFACKEKNSDILNNKALLPSHRYLQSHSFNQIVLKQKKATEIVFLKKNIPFRSFEIKKRDEKTLGELFSYFILETILLGRAMNINPFDQPSVELIKRETRKQFKSGVTSKYNF